MKEYSFIGEVAQRFHADMVAARAATHFILGVDAVRKVADRAAAAFVKELKQTGAVPALVLQHPELLARRDTWGAATIGDSILDAVEEDILRVLDVRLEWAEQFPEEFAPALELARAADEAIAMFDRVAREGLSPDNVKVTPYDDLERNDVVGPAKEALENFRVLEDIRTRDDLFGAMAPVVGGLRDLRWQAELDGFMAAVEAYRRLGRAPDGSWELAW